MSKYLRILKVLLHNSYIRDSKILGYVASSIAFNFVEILSTIIFFNVIFGNTKEMAGWNFYQMLFLYMIAKIVATIHGIFTKRGINQMSDELVRRGDLDFYLIKPVNTMFLVSISRPQVYTFISLAFEVILAAYALVKSGVGIGVINLIWLLLLLPFSVILFYFLRWITIIPAFWTIRLWSLTDIMSRMNQFMRYPAGIFPRIVKWSMFVLFPIMVVSYIPSRTLFYAPDYRFILYMILITVIFGYITNYLWKLGLKRYGSASS